MYVKNATKGTTLATDCMHAVTFYTRTKGLLGTRSLPRGSGILLERTKQVHMFFMHYAIDVAFLDSQNVVVECVHELRPWRVSPLVRKATRAVELPAGTLQATRTVPGDRLVLEPNA